MNNKICLNINANEHNQLVAEANACRKCPIEIFLEEKEGKQQLCSKETSQDDDLIQTLVGTPNRQLASNIIFSAIKALPSSMDDASKYNLVFQSLADAKPKDAYEARICTQAAVLHAQGLDFLERARSVLFDDGTMAKDHWHKILMKTATRLLDLHNKTLETLNRYRQKGEQRIVVQHVNVNDGGKAIVGNMIMATGESNK